VLLCAIHVETSGEWLFRIGCEQDLEGIVAKLKHGAYGEAWFKIRNPHYLRYEGRQELFEKRHTAKQAS
jgi:ATP-dependent DNA ligase